MTTKEQAIQYKKAGMSIIPVGKDKRPLIKWQKYQKEIADFETVEKWFSNKNAQIGIITGQISKIAVVDIEKEFGNPAKLNLPATTIAKTGGGGYHYYYTYREGATNKARINGMAVDVRAEGGYVVAPPSVSDKGAYLWIKKTNILPDLPDMFFKDPPKKINTTHKQPTLEYAGNNKGCRNQEITSFIGRLLPKVHPHVWNSLAWPQVVLANNKNTPPLPEYELRNTFYSMCSRERGNTTKRFYDKKGFEIQKTRDILKMTVPEFPYLIDKLIPERAITSLTSDSGKGKSLLSLIFARYVSSGEKLFDEFKVKKAKTLIIDQEMDKDLIVERCQKILTDNSDIDFLYEQDWVINIPEHFNWLVNKIKEENYKFLILDTLTNIHNKEENSSKEMREVNKLLLQLINETGVTILYLHHHRKQMNGEKTGQQTSRGSTEIIAKVASHLLVETKARWEDEQRILDITITQAKARRPDSVNSIGVTVTYDKQMGSQWYYTGEKDRQADRVAKAREFILEKLPQAYNREMTIADMKSLVKNDPTVDIGDSALRVACKELHNDKIIRYSMGGQRGTAKVYQMNENYQKEEINGDEIVFG